MKNIFSNKSLRLILLIQLAVFVIQPIVLIWKFSQVPDQIPFFYSRPRGIDQLASHIVLLIIPLINLGLIAVHSLVSEKYYKNEPLAAYFIVSISLVSTTLLLITFLRVIFLIS